LLGGHLVQIRRRQRRLSGQVEELETTIQDLLAMPLTDADVEGHNLDDLSFESEAEMGAAIPSLSSYPLFNSAPYGNLGGKNPGHHPLEKSFSEVKTSSAFYRPGSSLALPSASSRRSASAMGRGGAESENDVPGYLSYRARDTTTDGSQGRRLSPNQTLQILCKS
jgi:hypothetical protein